VRGGPITDVALGGLNYQIEHHLFPSMPRPNLRHSQALIREFCQQRDLPYCQSSLAGSYAQALRHLNSVGRSARSGTSASSGADGQPAVRADEGQGAGTRPATDATSAFCD
jgi:fatty acid desaturase